MAGSRGEEITVTHQVPTRTIFTVVERGHTKSLFAEVLETSLQVVDSRTLQSTQINSSPVLYSSVQTKYPRFGVTVSRVECVDQIIICLLGLIYRSQSSN